MLITEANQMSPFFLSLNEQKGLPEIEESKREDHDEQTQLFLKKKQI